MAGLGRATRRWIWLEPTARIPAVIKNDNCQDLTPLVLTPLVLFGSPLWFFHASDLLSISSGFGFFGGFAMPTKLPHLTDDQHFAIANVAGRAAQMDVQIEKTIVAGLRQQPKTAEYLLKNLGADRIVGLLKTVLLDTFPKKKDPIDALNKTIRELKADRNEILHWTWIPGQKPETSISATARPFREFRYNEMSADQIQVIADDMLAVTRALLKWQDALRERPVPPSPDKP